MKADQEITNAEFTGLVIKRLLKETHTTQSKLAESLGYTRSAVTQWVNGKTSPSTDSLIKIAQFFDVPLDTFIERPATPKRVKTNGELKLSEIPQEDFDCGREFLEAFLSSPQK